MFTNWSELEFYGKDDIWQWGNLSILKQKVVGIVCHIHTVEGLEPSRSSSGQHIEIIKNKQRFSSACYMHFAYTDPFNSHNNSYELGTVLLCLEEETETQRLSYKPDQ